MEIKNTREIRASNPPMSKKWIALEDLVGRIETICNHGNQRDMRFRNQLIKELGKDPEVMYK